MSAAGMPSAVPVGGMREAIAILWDSPFPAMLQGADFRCVDANAAFLAYLGWTREELVGHDPIERHPAADQPRLLAARERLRSGAGEAQPEPSMTEARMLGTDGRERRFRSTRRTLIDESGRPLYFSILQDATAEHAARERAERSLRELDDWFDLSPVGMVLFDDRGLLVRTNPAFDALAGAVPISLADVPEGLRQLLGWDAAAGLPALQPGAPAVQRQGWVALARGPARLLRVSLRCHLTAGAQHRYMAVVEDRSAEEERDLARVQIGALMGAAGIGLATFQASAGGMRLDGPAPDSPAPDPDTLAMQSIGSDIVTAASRPGFERLQSALRLEQRADVRYEVEHPEIGRRWLQTRVEPATLASGKRTMSVVTLDVTEQQQSQQRTEQLLHELSTILESTTIGIAYLRGNTLVRCNRRFETMLGMPGGAAAGQLLRALFGGTPALERVLDEAREALAEGSIYETEFDARTIHRRDQEALRWYSLSVRRTDLHAGEPEAIAVLADVTRLKSQQLELELLARDRELMFSLSGVGIAFVREGRIQRANQALAQMAGCTVAQCSGLALSDLFADADDHERRWAEQERSLREHGRWTGERPLRGLDGRLLWVQVSKRLVVPGDPAGGFIASYVNVDSRHRAERAVAHQAERTRSILDSVLVGIVTVGPQGIEWMNRSACRMFGGDLDDFVNLPIATVATAEADHPLLRTQYLTELVEGQAENFECQLQARDARRFWVAGNVVSTARESTGRQLTYALLDIQHRRESEARVARAQAQLQRIIEVAPLAITLRDAATLQVLQINGVAASIVGTTPAALVGRTPEQIFEPATAALRRRDMEQALASTEVSQREYQVVSQGELRIWDARYLPLATHPGEPPDQLLLVATDVTEQRAAQEARFEAAIAQRDMLVKEVHHRIKNNLQGVAGLLQQIAQRKPEVAAPIAEVVAQVQAIAQVYGLQVGAEGPLQLVGVVEAVTASVQRTFGQAICFVVEGASANAWQLPEAESIPIALTLNELLTNAVKHSTGQGADDGVHCTLVAEDDHVVVTISNHGRLHAEIGALRMPSGVSGLGLVRALLPRRSAVFGIEQREDRVVASVTLRPPGVVRKA